MGAISQDGCGCKSRCQACQGSRSNLDTCGEVLSHQPLTTLDKRKFVLLEALCPSSQ